MFFWTPLPPSPRRLASRLIVLSHMFTTEPNISKENKTDISGNEAHPQSLVGAL